MSCRCRCTSKPKPETRTQNSREKENAQRYPSSNSTSKCSRTPLSDIKTTNHLSASCTSTNTKTAANLYSSKSTSSLSSSVKTTSIKNNSTKVISNTVNKNNAKPVSSTINKTTVSTSNIKLVQNISNKTTIKNTSVNNLKTSVSSNVKNYCNNRTNTSNTTIKNMTTTSRNTNTKTVTNNVGNASNKNTTATANKFTPSVNKTIVSKTASNNIVNKNTNASIKYTSVTANKFTSSGNSKIISNTSTSNTKNTSVIANKFSPCANSTIVSKTASIIKNTSINNSTMKTASNKSTTINNSTNKNVITTSNCSRRNAICADNISKLTPNNAINSTLQCMNRSGVTNFISKTSSNNTLKAVSTNRSVTNSSINTSTNSTLQCTNKSCVANNISKTSGNNTLKTASTNRSVTISSINTSKNVSNNCSNVSINNTSVSNNNTFASNNTSNFSSNNISRSISTISSNVTQNKSVINDSTIISQNCSNNIPTKSINNVVSANKNTTITSNNNLAVTPLNTNVMKALMPNKNNGTYSDASSIVDNDNSKLKTNNTTATPNFDNISIIALNISPIITNININTTGDIIIPPPASIFPKVNTNNDLSITSNNETKPENILVLNENTSSNTLNIKQDTLNTEIIRTDIFRKTDTPVIQHSIGNLEIVQTAEENTPLSSINFSNEDSTFLTSLDKIVSTPESLLIPWENVEHFTVTETPLPTFNKILPKCVKFSSEITKITTSSTPIKKETPTAKQNIHGNPKRVTFNTFCSTIPAVEISHTPSKPITDNIVPLACSIVTKSSKSDTLFPTNNLYSKSGPSAYCTLIANSSWNTSAIIDSNGKKEKNETEYFTDKNDSVIDGTAEFWQTFKVIRRHLNINKSLINSDTTQIYSNTNTNGNLEKSVHDSIPKKKTFKKEILKPSEFLGVVNLDSNTNKVHSSLLYPDNLLEDLISHIISHQREHKLSFCFLVENIDLCEMRSILINWLVKLHQFLAPDTCILFIVIRLFDKILATYDVPENEFQIYALTIFWIVLKYNNSDDFTIAPDILRLCNGKYSLDYFLRMEKQILQYLDYNVNKDEPMIFVYYFIYVMKLPNCNIISFCANYFLEILSLAHHCNCFSLSLQAASAVFLTLKLFNIDDSYWLIVKDHKGYHEQKEMLPLHRLIIEQVLLMNEEEYPYRESYKKFSSEKYEKVSMIVAMKIAEFI